MSYSVEQVAVLRKDKKGIVRVIEIKTRTERHLYKLSAVCSAIINEHPNNEGFYKAQIILISGREISFYVKHDDREELILHITNL
jgi:hypothetical protein